MLFVPMTRAWREVLRLQPIAVMFDLQTSPRQRDWLRRPGVPVSC